MRRSRPAAGAFGTMDIAPWLTLAGLGMFHGLNPGMGWLFAVALALQRQSPHEIWRALPPIALGHFVSVALFGAAVLLLQAALPEVLLRAAASLTIAGFATFRLWRKKHLNWVGMQVGFRDLTVWSFLMATAHGAGLMLTPVLLGGGLVCAPGSTGMWAAVGGDQLLASSTGAAVAAVLVHSSTHLLVAALMAFFVFRVLGVRVLRSAWINVDQIWIGVLFVAAVSVWFV